MNQSMRIKLCWELVVAEALLVFLVHVMPGLLPGLVTKAAIALVPIVFMFAHGSLFNSLRHLVVFTGITLFVSNGMENIGVLTGFPFGHYYYADSLGPKLFNVPLLVGPVYLGTGYLAWTIAKIIGEGASGSGRHGQRVIAVPILAAWMMVAFDLVLDPVWATIERAWIWRDGGHYFGIPFANFLGWMLTTFVFFALYSAYLRRSTSEHKNYLTREGGAQALVMYGLTALAFILNPVTAGMSSSVTDPSGRPWSTADIYTVTSLLALFVMGAWVAVGAARLPERADRPRRAESTEAVEQPHVPHPVAASAAASRTE